MLSFYQDYGLGPLALIPFAFVFAGIAVAIRRVQAWRFRRKWDRAFARMYGPDWRNMPLTTDAAIPPELLARKARRRV